MHVATNRRGTSGFRQLFATALCGACVLAPASAQVRPSVDEMLQRITEEYGPRERKYEALLEVVSEAVEEALAEFTWTSGPGEGTPRPLAQHPHLTFIADLAETARARASGRKNPAGIAALIETYPWNSQLELTLGLEYGSDRPIPKNKGGFVVMPDSPNPVPGYPELSVNQYLYGLGEIAGWRTGVKKGKAKYGGRKPKQRATLVEELPAWEALRVYLTGTVPDVPLLAIPELTHRIHSRLLQRRMEQTGERPPMDEFLALLDSKWNGFTIDVPYSKDPLTFVVPVHSLYVDTKGFLYQFPGSAQMASVGDLPFMAIHTHMQYSAVFRGVRIDPGDLISNTPKGVAARREFDVALNYLTRYKTLIDLIVRTVLSPEVPYPEYLTLYGYPESRPPEARTFDSKFDVTQRQALLLWAAVNQDPEQLADWLHDELLSKPEHVFPSKASLVVAFLTLARESEGDLLDTVAQRITLVRKITDHVAEAEASRASGSLSADFEREYSPFEIYLSVQGKTGSNALAHSFQTFHAPLSEAVRAAAYGAVLKELEK